MKKICFLYFCLCVLLLLCGVSAYAADDSGLWEYTSCDGGVELTAYKGTQTDVYVPSNIKADGESMAVVKLGDNLFSEKTALNSVTLGEGITEIGAGAFQDASNLVCIVTPESLTTIGDNAFSGCTAFNSVILYDAVTSIGENAFKDCGKLTIYCNENSFAHSFADSNNIKYVLLNAATEPESIVVDGIEYHIQDGIAIAISADTSLTDVIVPSEINGYPVTELRGTFENCVSLVNVSLPYSLKKITSGAFAKCTSLVSIVIPETVDSVSGFSGCTSLTSVNIPEKVTVITSSMFASCSSLEEIIIPQGVTLIDSGAFSGCTSLRNINIPESVRYFGTYVFNGCSGLETIVLPNRINEITRGLFSGCVSLKNIELPQNVKEIDIMAFSGCSNLESITLYGKLETIGYRAFDSCKKLHYIQLPSSVKSIDSDASLDNIVLGVEENSYAHNFAQENNFLYYLEGIDEELKFHTADGIKYCILNGEAIALELVDTSLTEIVLPATILDFPLTDIRKTFSQSNIVSIQLGDNIQSLYQNAFYVCKKLKDVYLTNSLKEIGKYSFFSCSSIENIEIPDSVSEIGVEAFGHCSNLTQIEIPEGISIIERYTFYCCNKLAKISLPSTLKEIGAYAFYHCEPSQIVIPTGVTIIGDYAFDLCTELATLELPESLISIGKNAFHSCFKIESIKIPESVTTIGDHAFDNCSHLQSIEIPDSVTSIGEYAFANIYYLEQFEIPKGISAIPNYMLYKCPNLTNVVIGENITSIGEYAFTACTKLKNIEIPDSITTIGSYAFNECTALSYVKIPQTVSAMSADSFSGGTILLVMENSYAHTFADENGLIYVVVITGDEEPELYDVDGIRYCVVNGEAIAVKIYGSSSGIMPDEVEGYPVTDIKKIFKGNTRITSVVLPKGITKIEKEAFKNSSVEEIVIPEGVTSIGDSAFEWSNLTAVTIPDTVTEIGEKAFYYCTKLQNVKLSNSISTIKKETFSGCHKLENIEIPESVKQIEYLAFCGCSVITEVRIPSGTVVCGQAFWNCTNLSTVIMSTGAKLERESFYANRNLTNVILPDDLTEIPAYAFNNCENLSNIILPETLTKIDYLAFERTNLKKVILPKNLKSISTNSFPSEMINIVYEGSAMHDYVKKNNKLYFVIKETQNPEIPYGEGITGTVTYTDGTAVSGATVEILYDDGTVKETVTADENGAYAFTYAEVGRYTIRVTDGSGNTGSETVSVKRMNVFDVFLAGQTNIVLKKGYTVSGNISPAAEGTVTLTDSEGNVIAGIETADGSFSIENVPGGTYILKAETESGTAVSEITVFDSDISGITLVVETENNGTVTGYVEVEDREYNHHRRGWVHITVYNSDGVAVASQKTDDDGKYTFVNLPFGEYSIVAEATEMRPDKHKYFERSHTLTGYAYVNVEEAKTYELETIVLYEENDYLATISGKVTANGENQSCQVILSNVFRHEIAQCKTGNNGKYTFTNVRDGLYFVTAVTDSNGMGFTIVLVRGGNVYGTTDIKVVKAQKIHEREQYMNDNIPHCESREDAIRYRDKIAEEKKYYDGLSEKEKKQFSKEYRDRLEKLCGWISDCTNTGNGGTLENGEMILSEEELKSEDTFEIVLDITESAETEIGDDGIQNRDQYIQQSIYDTAGDKSIVKYYDISLTKKDSQGNAHKITSVAKDTDTTGKVRITMDIPEEYRGHKHYHFVHVHNGVTTVLTDLDDDPDTITFEVDRFSTFALTYTDEELSVDDEAETEEEEEEVTNFGTRNACIRAMLNENTKCRVTLLAGIDGLKYKTVGFEVTVGGTTRMFDTKTVYTSVSALSAEGKRVKVTAEDFGGDAEYIFGTALSFGEAFKDETLVYRPYAVDFKGNYIYGKESTITPIFK